MTLSWDSLCRLCATEENCDISLYSKDGESEGVVNIINKYLSISVNVEENHSSKLCRECGEKITEIHHFATKCQQAQLFFHTYRNNTILQDELHLQYLKSKFNLDELPLKVKKEINIDIDDDIKNEDDTDYIPLSDIKENKDKIKVKCTTKLKGAKSKKNRQCINLQKKELKLETKADNKILHKFDDLLDGDIISNIGENIPLKHRTRKRKHIKEEQISDDGGNVSDYDCTEDNDNDQDNYDNEGKLQIFIKKQIDKNKNYKDADYSIYSFTCHLCQMEHSSWDSLRSHAKKIHKCKAQVMCICLKLLSSRKLLLKHISKHDRSKCFTCHNCDKIFSSSKELDNHAHVHLPKEEQPYVCCKCAKRFTTPRILKVHERIHTPREERFIWPCDICGIKFATKGAVGTHKRVIHEKLKPYVCDLCGHACSTKKNLEEHRIRHGTDKNFVCDKCQKRFKTKGALVRHVDTHGDTAYQCPHCPMLLNSRRTLRNHLFVHDEQAKHVCPFCGKAFKRRKDIKCHLKLHTGERPYSCPWCPRAFTNGSNCRIHKRRMHPNEFKLAEENNPFAPAISLKNDSPKKVIHTTIRVHPVPVKSDLPNLQFGSQQTETLPDNEDQIMNGLIKPEDAKPIADNLLNKLVP